MIELHNADCLEVLKTLPDKSVDLILQDPPYNTTACKWEWDIMTKIDEFWAEWKRVIKDNGAIVMTASQPFTTKLIASNYKMFKYEWIWEKTRCSNPYLAKFQLLRKHENILVFGNAKIYNPQKTDGKEYTISKLSGGRVASDNVSNNINFTGAKQSGRYPSSVQKISNPSLEVGLHPTQKPVALMEYLIKTYTNEGDTVFDGFMGSGTTLVACKNLNRNGIGVELDSNYFEIAKKRINETLDNRE